MKKIATIARLVIGDLKPRAKTEMSISFPS